MSKQVGKKQGNLFAFLKGTKDNNKILEKRLLKSKEKSEDSCQIAKRAKVVMERIEKEKERRT